MKEIGISFKNMLSSSFKMLIKDWAIEPQAFHSMPTSNPIVVPCLR
jgi:hypothetical protein